MLRWRILRFFEAVSIFWWLLAGSVTAFYTTRLPRIQRGEESNGCVLTSDWFDYVECGPGWGWELLEGVLSFALYWTKEIGVLVFLSSVPILMPIGLLWLASVVLGLSGLLRLISKAVSRLRA